MYYIQNLGGKNRLFWRKNNGLKGSEHSANSIEINRTMAF